MNSIAIQREKSQVAKKKKFKTQWVENPIPGLFCNFLTVSVCVKVIFGIEVESKSLFTDGLLECFDFTSLNVN
jgi:hypothetical protein